MYSGIVKWLEVSFLVLMDDKRPRVRLLPRFFFSLSCDSNVLFFCVCQESLHCTFNLKKNYRAVSLKQTYMKAYHNTALQMYALAFLIHGLAHRSL